GGSPQAASSDPSGSPSSGSGPSNCLPFGKRPCLEPIPKDLLLPAYPSWDNGPPPLDFDQRVFGPLLCMVYRANLQKYGDMFNQLKAETGLPDQQILEEFPEIAEGLFENGRGVQHYCPNLRDK